MNDYLYHYTNISSLALILKNKTSRLNSLLNMDDADEVVTKNNEYLGKYCFVSSWTDLSEESIPFWSLYTKDMTGIRIRLQKYPFKKRTLVNPLDYQGIIENSYIPEEIWMNNRVFVYPCLDFLRKVEYTNEEEKLYPNVIDSISANPDGTSNFSGNFKDINRYKRKCWEFQSEWRYGILVFPCDEHRRFKMDLKPHLEDIPFSFIDLKIEEDAFVEMEIVLGPKMNKGDKEVVKCLVEKYCPTATIRDSELRIK